MKRFVSLLLVSVLLVAIPPLMAAEKEKVEQFVIKDGMLMLPESPVPGQVRVLVTADGKLVSPIPNEPGTPRPTTDPALIRQWEATQVWINSNLPLLRSVVDQLRVEGKNSINPQLFINQNLQNALTREGAANQIAGIAESMERKRATPVTAQARSLTTAGRGGDQASVNGGQPPHMQNCGPMGSCMIAVWVCTWTSLGGSECHVVNCNSGCGGCCYYET